MRGKILLVVGLAAGYVLGAKAGRGRYEDIKRVTATFWGDPRVQRQVRNVEGRAIDFAKDKASGVIDFLGDGAKKVVSQSGRARPGKAQSGKAQSGKAQSGRARSGAAQSGAARPGASSPEHTASAGSAPASGE